MKSCNKMIDVGRRKFLTGGTTAAAAAVVLGAMPPAAGATPALARVTYPRERIGNVKDLKVDQPVQISYPDDDSPGVLLKLGRRVEAGVGPDSDIVASRRSARTRAFHLRMLRQTRAWIAPATTPVSIAKEAGRKSSATRRKTCPNSN
jgi:arsenite oxidase small subunit